MTVASQLDAGLPCAECGQPSIFVGPVTVTGLAHDGWADHDFQEALLDPQPCDLCRHPVDRRRRTHRGPLILCEGCAALIDRWSEAA